MDEGLARIRHERSMKDFPFLELEDNEYVEYAFRRAKIWLHLILGGLAAGLIFILLAFLLVLLGQDTLDGIGISFLYIMLGAMVAAVFLAAISALWYVWSFFQAIKSRNSSAVMFTVTSMGSSSPPLARLVIFGNFHPAAGTTLGWS